MANRFWVGGTGNWDAADTTHWAATSGGSGGQSVPTSSDTVTFDASSGAGTVTITATAECSSWTSGAHTGTIDTNGQTVNCVGTMNTSGSGSRTLTLGASTINCDIWTATVSNNLTFNANTSVIIVSGASTFSGARTYNEVRLTTTAGATISGANTFATLKRTNASGYAGLVLNANQTVTGTLTVTGNNANTERISVASGTEGTARTITAAVVALTNVDFTDITGAGAATWSGTSLGDAQGNTNITFTTPVTRYWVGNGGDWTSTTHWSTSSGGASGASVPLCQDSAIFDASSFSSGSQTVTVSLADYKMSGMDWSLVDSSPTFNPGGGITTSWFGSLVLTSNMTIAGTQQWSLKGRGNYSLTMGGASFSSTVAIDGIGAVWTAQDDTRWTSFSLSQGTFDANDHDVYVSNSCSITGSAVRTLDMGDGTWFLSRDGNQWTATTTTNLTFFARNSTIKITGALTASRNFAGGGLTYNNFWNATTGAFPIVIVGSNTFNDFKIDAGRTQHFTAGTTTTISSLTVGAGITITSATAATHTLSDAAGTNDALNATISYSIATGGATWNATGGTDAGNNTGWNFLSATSIKTFDGLVYASTKTVDGLAIASVKTWDSLA